MKKFNLFLLGAMFGVAACDLQPKIVALPDTVGEFITSRYPALLADPKSQPEIYNSAATDYGVYASPELYGGAASVDDYVLYSSVDDYIVPPQPAEQETAENVEPDDVVDTEDYDFTSDDVLVVPDEPSKEEPEEPKPEQDDIAWDENAKTDDRLDIPGYKVETPSEITVVRGDTLYLLSKKYGVSLDELAAANNLSEPYLLRVGQKLRLHAEPGAKTKELQKVTEQKTEPKKQEVRQEPKPEQKPKSDESRKTTTRVDVDVIDVAPGDTLYSLSRKYSIPVNDLAVMNNLNAPFALYAGQKLKVPDLASAPVRTVVPKVVTTEATKTPVKTAKQTSTKQPAQKTEKQTKRPQKQQTAKDKSAQQKPQNVSQKQKAKTTNNAKTSGTITARSSSKFTWPVRGKILSNYGSKTNGLFNDGINISANTGTAVSAAENGVVAYAGNEVKGMGNLVIIQHSDGWMTVYAHMDSMNVRRGAHVKVGQKIGTVGKTGKVDKPQLHFEVRKGTKAYNPIQYLKK